MQVPPQCTKPERSALRLRRTGARNRRCGWSFATLQKPKDRQEQQQAQQKEYHSALMMKLAVEKSRIDILRKNGQRGDAHSVFNDHDQQTTGCEDGLLPERAQK